MRNRFGMSLSFRDFHRPTRHEINEFLEVCSSFDRMGRAKSKVICDKIGNPVPASEFIRLNTSQSILSDRRVNPNETVFFVTQSQEFKRKTDVDRKRFKKLKRKCNREIIAKGGNPKKWKLYINVPG